MFPYPLFIGEFGGRGGVKGSRIRNDEILPSFPPSTRFHDITEGFSRGNFTRDVEKFWDRSRMRAARRWESAMCAMVFVSLNGNLRPPSLDPWCSELVTEYFLLFSSRWDGSLSCLKSRRLRRGREEGNLNPPINYLCRPTVLTFSPASSSPKKKSYFQAWKSNRSKSDHFSFGIYGEWILFFIIILDCLWLLRMVDNRSRPIVKGKWFSFPFVRVKRILNIDNFVKNIYEISNAPLCSFVTFYLMTQSDEYLFILFLNHSFLLFV